MRLSLGASLQLIQTQKQLQKLTAEQRLEMRQEQIHKLGESIINLLESGQLSPSNQYDAMVKRVLPLVKGEELREMLGQYANNAHFKRAALERPNAFALPTEGALNEFALRAFHSFHEGAFELECPVEGSDKLESRTVNITQKQLRDALEDPAKALKELEEFKGLVDIAPDKAMARRHMHDLRDAIDVATLLKPHIKGVSSSFDLLSRLKDSEGTPFKDFFRDLVVLPRISFLVSERMMMRFSDRFRQMGKNSKQSEYEIPFGNTVADYALVSMGVVSPQLFALKSQSFDEIAYNDMKLLLKEDGHDLDALMKHYRLQIEGTFYWNRWAVQGRRQTRITDEWVREFSTKTVRAELPDILDAADFDDVFREAKQIVEANGKSVEGCKQTDEQLRELLLTTFTDDGFKEFLVGKIKGPWYAKMMEMLPAKEDETSSW